METGCEPDDGLRSAWLRAAYASPPHCVDMISVPVGARHGFADAEETKQVACQKSLALQALERRHPFNGIPNRLQRLYKVLRLIPKRSATCDMLKSHSRIQRSTSSRTFAPSFGGSGVPPALAAS